MLCTPRIRVQSFRIVLFLGALLIAPSADAQIPVVDSCIEANYLDRSAPTADRSFNWDFSFAGDPERCIKIAAGQTVQWNGNLSAHPLDPDQGTTPNPIANHVNGSVTFTQPGVYGYRCNYHFEMRGAVWVVPAATPTPTPLFSERLSLLLLGVLLGGSGFIAWKAAASARRQQPQ